MAEYGFQSFKFRDPLFGAKRKHAEQIAELGDEFAGEYRFAPLAVLDGPLMPGDLGDLLQAAGDLRLIEAVKHRDTSAVRALLKQSVDVNAHQPDGATLIAGKPVIAGITRNADGSYHLAGTQLNGISEGAAYVIVRERLGSLELLRELHQKRLSRLLRQ